MSEKARAKPVYHIAISLTEEDDKRFKEMQKILQKEDATSALRFCLRIASVMLKQFAAGKRVYIVDPKNPADNIELTLFEE